MAQGLATNGAKVYIGGRRKEVLEKAAAGFQSELGGSLVPYDTSFSHVLKLCG
jgi:NADP-dependent 3-hydroxy acid dehydrogenase YdfG